MNDNELADMDRKWDEWRRRNDLAIATVGCPTCFSLPAEECRYSNGKKSEGVHSERLAKVPAVA